MPEELTASALVMTFRFSGFRPMGFPACDFCGNSNAQVEKSNAQVESTHAEVGIPNAKIHNTNAEIHDMNAQVKTLWVTGTLKISSTPSGAKVYVNGSYEGSRP